MDDEIKPKQSQLEPGDCIAEHLGDIELTDGRRFQGIILTFPAGPPKLPISAVWDKLPLRLTLKSDDKR